MPANNAVHLCTLGEDDRCCSRCALSCRLCRAERAALNAATRELVAAEAEPDQPTVFNNMPWPRSFGIEIECAENFDGVMHLADEVAATLSSVSGSRVTVENESDDEGFDSSPPLVTLSNGWGVCYDGSCGYEIKSPILSGTAGLESVSMMMRAMQLAGCETNNSCGIHIHVDARDVRRRSDKMNNLAAMIALAEPLFFSVVNQSRWGNTYCRFLDSRTLRSIHAARSMESVIAGWYTGGGGVDEYTLREAYNARTEHYHGTRYYGANMHSVFYRGSLEFRYFNSTLANRDLVKSWIALAVGTVEYAMRADRLRFPSAVAMSKNYDRFSTARMVKRFGRMMNVLSRGRILGGFPEDAARILADRVASR